MDERNSDLSKVTEWPEGASVLAGQSRAAQTWIIVGAIVLSVMGFIVWQESNRDFLSMPPETRCEYYRYRVKYGWESELQCKAHVAAAGLRGESFSDENPYRR